MEKTILYFVLIFIIVLNNSCNRKHDCTDEKRYPFSKEDLKWVQLVDTSPSFKITSRYSGFHIDTVKTNYNIVYEEKYETTEWCGKILYSCYSVDLEWVTLHDGRVMSPLDLNFENTKKGGGMRVHFGADEYLYDDTKLDTALINGKIYNDVFKSRSGNFYAKGIGWIFFKNDQNETAELIPKE